MNRLSTMLLISLRSWVCSAESSLISVRRLKATSKPSFEITPSSSVISLNLSSASSMVLHSCSKLFSSSSRKYAKFLRCKTGLWSRLNLIRQSGAIEFSVIVNSRLMSRLSLFDSWPDLSISLWISRISLSRVKSFSLTVLFSWSKSFRDSLIASRPIWSPSSVLQEIWRSSKE